MIFSVKKAGVCLLAAGLLCVATAAPALAAPRELEGGQQEIVELTEGAEEAPSRSATTTVTAYIEAEPVEPTPDEPSQPASTDGEGSLSATGDPGAGAAYVLLLGAAGMIALSRVVRVR